MADTFVPSRHGFAFDNAWPSQPAVVLPTLFGDIRVGDAADGLCGGMTFAALDYWRAGAAPPVERPAAGQPLYRYIVDRLIESWHVPAGVAQYYQWMNLPDGDATFRIFGRRVLTERGLSWRTIRIQWPQVRKDLDRGLPVPIGVVTVSSKRPQDLGLNHQVLAYGYRGTGSRVTLQVYDPTAAAATTSSSASTRPHRRSRPPSTTTSASASAASAASSAPPTHPATPPAAERRCPGRARRDVSSRIFAPVRATCGPYAPAGTAAVGGSLGARRNPRPPLPGPRDKPNPHRPRSAGVLIVRPKWACRAGDDALFGRTIMRRRGRWFAASAAPTVVGWLGDMFSS